MTSSAKILVTGAGGQLSSELSRLASSLPAYAFEFLSQEDLPIDDFEKVRSHFAKTRPAFCINCAAYTAVDRAETEKETAFLVNGEAVGVLAAASRETGAKFIHISTDYVFDGTSSVPYREDDPVGPVSVYGASKLKGEALCRQYDPEAIIIRTAWVYSEFGHNFVKTMIRLMNERSSINVVDDQLGAPTYAADLAGAIGRIIQHDPWVPGTYHYSNEGRISWYDFAVAIKEMIGSSCEVHPVPTTEYPTPARRPSFSLLDTTKIKTVFGLSIPYWKDSLRICLRQLQQVG